MKRPLCWLATAFFLLLFPITWYRDWTSSVPIYSMEEVVLSGTVKEKVLKTGAWSGSWELVLEDVFMEEEKPYRLEGKYLLRISLKNPPLIGQRIRVSASPVCWEQASNPGQFDLGQWYHSQGIMGEFRKGKLLEKTEEYSVLWERLWQFRESSKDLLQKSMGEEKGAVIAAMVLGEKDGLTEETKELYQRNGISHILAISGLHLMLLGMGAFKSIKLLLPKGKAAELLACMLMVFYCIFAGGSISLIRATIMFVMTLLAKSLGRTYDSLSALAAAALLQLLYNPYALENSGFLLSFFAVLGVTCVAPVLQQLFETEGRLWSSLWVSASASITTLPILLTNYGVFCWYGIFLNLIILPPISLLLAGGILLLPLSFLISAGGSSGFLILFHSLLSQSLKLILWYYEFCCRIFEQLPFQEGYSGSPSVFQIFFYYLFLLLLILSIKYPPSFFKTIPGFWKKTAILFLVLFLTLKIPAGCEITMLDVGQGDGFVIKNSNGNVYMIDGGSSDVSQVGKYRLLPYLKNKGYHKIRGIFLSHLDKDHYNGVLELLEEMKEERLKIETLIITPQAGEGEEKEKLQALLLLAKKNGVKVLQIKEGEILKDKELEFYCLAPPGGVKMEESNASGMVLEVAYGEFQMLFTGDVEGKGEDNLTKLLENRKQTYEILKVAHHGSAGSTSESFLQQIEPGISLISCGKNNTYGHPAESVLNRLTERGSLILDTRKTGAVTIRPTRTGDFSIECFLGRNQD